MLNSEGGEGSQERQQYNYYNLNAVTREMVDVREEVKEK